VRARDEYVRGQRALIADGTSAGDNVLIIGGWSGGGRTRSGSGAVASFDPRGTVERGQTAVLRAVRRAERAAGRKGRALRVLAQMEAIAAPGEALEDLVARELRFGELTSGGAVSVVCAYRRDAWDAAMLGDLTAVHRRHVGAVESVGFRMTYAGAGCWSLRGAVDFDGIRAFAAVLRASMARTGRVRLLCHELDLMDAAALRIMVEAVRDTPGGAVQVEGANDTVLKAWRLSGYGAMDVQVQVGP
jgi:hypothetical protein